MIDKTDRQAPPLRQVRAAFDDTTLTVYHPTWLTIMGLAGAGL